MPSRSANRSGAMVLCDADVGSLVCTTHCSEDIAFASGEASPAAVHLVACGLGSAGRASVLSRWAAFHGATINEKLPAGLNDTDTLLAAGRLAAELAVARVIWPAHAGIAGDPESIDLERAAAIANTAALVERVLEIETEHAPAIEAPFADLCDRQLADLAVDLGLVPGEVWWAGTSGEVEQMAHERWSAAFAACGAPIRGQATSRARSGRG